MNAPHADPRTATRALHELPEPPGLPWLGQMLGIDRRGAHRTFERWAAELGTPYRVRIPGRQLMIFTDRDEYHRIARERPQHFRRTSGLREAAAEMGFNGLFTAEGADWEPQRRLVMSALHPGQVKSFFPTLRAITERLHRRWDAAARDGAVIEMTEDLMRYTVDVTSALAFGEDPNTIESDADPIQRHLASILPMLFRRAGSALHLWRWLRLPADRRLDRDLAAVRVYIDGLIERARSRMGEDADGAPRNLLESFLRERDRPGSGMDDATVRANVLTMLLAGEDTTAYSLAWAMPYLAADPALQDALHAQACELLGDAPACPDPGALAAMDRFEAVVTEAQRLRPVTPLHGFEPLEDTVVDGVRVPRGTRIFYLARPAMQRADNFHDPERYDPSRWLQPRGAQRDSGAHDARAFVQFGAGARVCPGRHLSGVEMRFVMSMLMRHFRVELAMPAAAIEERTSLTMSPSRMPVRLVPRTSGAPDAASA